VALGENFVLAGALLKLDATSTNIDVLSASIAGAYTFVTGSFFAQTQQRNLLIADIMSGCLRLAMAIPIGFALGGLSTAAGASLAFAVGVFPLSTIKTMLRQIANKKLPVELGPAEGASQITQLSGVDSAAAERFEYADITTVSQLAWCDPIDLTMRTNLRFAYINDAVSQALAWVYLEDALSKLRPFGLRGAFEIHDFLKNGINSADAAQQTAAKAVMAAAANAVGMSPDSLENAFEQIAYDTVTEFLYEAG